MPYDNLMTPHIRKKRKRTALYILLVAVLIIAVVLIFQRKQNSEPELKTDIVDKVKLRLFFGKLKSMLKGDWGSSNEQAFCNLILKTADWPLCGDGIQISESIIYSFGIADNYDFEAQSGKFGFQVKAFDPTRNYPKELADNVTFFSWGLRGDMVKQWSHHAYGDTLGQLLTFPDILERSGHDSSANIILKIDCEGCEWEGLSLLHKYPDILEKIQQINIEFHFTTTLRVNSSSDLLHIESVHEILADQGFLPWYIFPQGGSKSDRVHLDIIRELGFPNNICCFEVGFLRKPTQVLNRPNISPNQIKLSRQESLWKWGQIWGNDGIEYIDHKMLSKSASLTKIKRAPLRNEIISQNSHEPESFI